jgi:hypothetical protein
MSRLFIAYMGRPHAAIYRHCLNCRHLLVESEECRHSTCGVGHRTCRDGIDAGSRFLFARGVCAGSPSVKLFLRAARRSQLFR